jgi:hypothetical protein
MKCFQLQISPRETASPSAGQEILHLLQNINISCPVQKSPPMDLIQSKMNPLLTLIPISLTHWLPIMELRYTPCGSPIPYRVTSYLEVSHYTPISCAKRLNDFRGLICSHASIFQNFSSVSTILFECFFMSHTEPVACHFSQAWIHTTLWELESQDIYDETYGYIFCKFFFPCKSFDNKHTPFNSELHFSINVDRLSTSLTKPDY